MSSNKFIARNGLAVGTTPVDIVDSTGTILVNAPSATKLQTARTISLSGDVAGSVSFDGTGNVDISTTVQPNSVALGTDTTGNYMLNVAAGTGVSVSHTQGEGSTATVSIGQAVGTTDNVTFNNVTVNGTLTSDDITSTNISVAGNATITGNLTVSGTTTTVNSTTVAISDLNLELAKNATTAAQANGAGITIDGPATPATFTYTSADDRWNLNKDLNINRVYGNLTGAVTGNASTASAWQTARTLSFTGDATGSMSVDGSGNASTALTLAASGVTAGTYNNVTVDTKGRVTSGSNVSYLTSYSETDTLATVTARGATHTTGISWNGSAGSTALDYASNDGYVSMRVIRNAVSSGGNSDGMYIGYSNGNSGITRIFGGGATSGGIVVNGSGVNNVTIAGYTAYHAGNLTNLNQLTNGPGYITGESDTLSSVTGRGASTSIQSAFNGGLTSSGYTNLGGQVYISGTNTNTLNSGYGSAADGSDIWLNYRGYNDGFSYYRNFNVGNGKGTAYIWGDGANQRLGVAKGQNASYTLDVGGIIYSNTSVRAPIFYDADDTNYYADPNATSRFVSHIIGGHGGTVYDTASTGRLYFGVSSNNDYSIYTHMENYGGNYTKLTIDWHTGIKIGAYYGYGGIRFYNNAINAGGSEVFSIAKGDNHVRVNNNLYVAGNSYLGDANGDETWVNDVLRVGASDSGDSHFYFGEDSSSWYGSHWYWDSSFTHYWYSRHAGSDSTIMYHDTRNTDRLQMARNLRFDNYGLGIIGTYTSTRYQGVFAMDMSYKLPDDGTTTGTLYGLAWSHPNAGGVAANLNTHGLLAMENGGWLASLTGSTRARDDMRAPIFYDNNDTGYYLDPNSTSNSALRIRGGALHGPNPTWGKYLYIGTDGNPGTGNSSIAVTNGNLHLDAENGYVMYLNNYSSSSYTVLSQSARSPIFYDNNDTGYYGDFASTSRFYTTITNISYFGADSNKGYAQGYGTYSTQLHKIARITFDWDSNYNAENHGIFSTNINGSYSDNMSINSYNDINLRIDSNDNDAASYVRFHQHTTGNNQFAYIGYDGSQYIANFSGRTRSPRFVYDSDEAWRAPFVKLQDSAPSATNAGDLWWQSSTGKLKIWYYDGNTSQWVDAVPIPDTSTFFSKAGGAITGPTVISSSLSVGGAISAEGPFTMNTVSGSTGSINRAFVIKTAGSSLIDMGSYPGSWTSALQIQSNDNSAYLWLSPLTANIPRLQTNYGAFDIFADQNGTVAGRFYPGSTRAYIFYDLNDTGYYCDPNSVSRFVNLRLTSDMYINSASPTIHFVDSDERGAALHNNSNLLYILSSNGTGGESWSQNGSYWPFYINLNNNNATFGGDVWAAGNVTAYSDIKLKENIVTVDNALDKVLSLRGVYYTLKRDENKVRKLGVIAQEVQEILPEVVMNHIATDPNTGKEGEHTLGVDYGNIVGLLIEAIKEQQKQIEELKVEVKALRG